MKILFFPLLLCALNAHAQFGALSERSLQTEIAMVHTPKTSSPGPDKTMIQSWQRWKIDRNRIITGALLFTAGGAKGFNEGLQYRYKGFEALFPKANDQWFYPTFSFKNKYEGGDPNNGARFPLSTSVLVMFTDQYHLNNFIQKSALTAALVIKIGEGKKPIRHYIFDAIYYTLCYQAGFHLIYQPISMNNDR